MRDIRRCTETLFIFVVLLLSSGAFAPLWTDPPSDGLAVDGEFGLQLMWAAIYALIVILLLPHIKTVVAIAFQNKWLVLLAAWCVASAAWSENPVVTLRKCIAILGTSLLGVLLAVRFSVRAQVRLIAAVLGLAAIASLIVALSFPGAFPATEFASQSWNGVFSHKNLLGRAMSLGTVAFFALPRCNLSTHLSAIGGATLCAALLVASHSQTALVVLLAIMSLGVLSAILGWEWRQATGSALLLLTCSIPAVWIAISHASDLTALLHRDQSLTGRSKIWTFALLSFAKHPWIGYGYGAFWWVAQESRQTLALIGYKTPHAHNGFLDLGLQLGGIGIAIFVASWFWAVFAAIRYLRHHSGPEGRWPLLYLAFIVFYSLTENSLLTPNSLLWILYVAACVSITLKPHTTEEQFSSPNL